MGQMARTIRIVVWSCLVLWTLGRAVPSDDFPPTQNVTLSTQEPYVETSSVITRSANEDLPGSGATASSPSSPSSVSENRAFPEALEETQRSDEKNSSSETSTEKMCSPASCDTQSTLMVTVDPVGNKTGFVSRAIGSPVWFQCALLTQGRQVPLPIIWRLPNATEIVSERLHIYSVDLTDAGEYTCLLAPNECCTHVQPYRVHLEVYELSDAAGILLMLSVPTSIAILVVVFIYSQKKKKYHAWLKHEILAASSSSGDSTPRSTLNRDMQTNSKKYLLNT